jgi:hypothetical protein
MPAPSLAKVEHASVTAVNLTDRAPQTIRSLRYRDQMDMIGQQAVRPDLDIVSLAPMSHQFPVALVIFVTKKRLLSTVSPLSDVMGKTRSDNTPSGP